MDTNGINDWVEHLENPYRATNSGRMSRAEQGKIDRDVRHSRLRIEHDVLEDVADLFELYAKMSRANSDVDGAQDFTTAFEAVTGLMRSLHDRSLTLAEAGRSAWNISEGRLRAAAAEGLIHPEVLELIELHWAPPAPAHTQDAAVPPACRMCGWANKAHVHIMEGHITSGDRPTIRGPFHMHTPRGATTPANHTVITHTDPADFAWIDADADPFAETLQVAPTGYHAHLREVIRASLAAEGIHVTSSPDPYAPPFKIDAIKSDTPSGFPLKGFTLTETRPTEMVTWGTAGGHIAQPWPPRGDVCGAVTTAKDGTSWCNQKPHRRGNHAVLDRHGAILREWDNLDDTLARHAIERAHGAFACYDRTTFNPTAGLPAAIANLPLWNDTDPKYGDVIADHPLKG